MGREVGKQLTDFFILGKVHQPLRQRAVLQGRRRRRWVRLQPVGLALRGRGERAHQEAGLGDAGGYLIGGTGVEHLHPHLLLAGAAEAEEQLEGFTHRGLDHAAFQLGSATGLGQLHLQVGSVWTLQRQLNAVATPEGQGKLLHRLHLDFQAVEAGHALPLLGNDLELLG